MPPDVTGVNGAAGGVPLPPSAPVRPVGPPRAVVPVEKTGPRAIPGANSPLGRSGVSLVDLLFSPDVVETRSAVAPVAMEMGMEQARGQLLRQRPSESLVALDAVWARAQHSEEGWYLRSGALTVLGLPGEGERVAAEALVSRPASLALRLVQSVARALMGDLSGARAALAPALETAPDDPVLTAQQAVVLARQGHLDDARHELDRLSVLYADHPAFVWARTAIRSAQADRTRRESMPLRDPVSDHGTLPDGTDAFVADASVADAAVADAAAADAAVADMPDDLADNLKGTATDRVVDDMPDVDADPIAVWRGSGDVLESAFGRLGARMAAMGPDDVVRTARLLMRACSSGGALASACTPEQAHAARSVLSSLMVVVQGDEGSPSPITPLVSQLWPLLRGVAGDESALIRGGSDRDRRLEEATRVLRRQGSAIPAPARRLLEVLVDAIAWHTSREAGSDGAIDPAYSAAPRAAAAPRASAARTESAPTDPLVFERDDRESGPLVPVRLGLSLLTDTPATRAVERTLERSIVVEGTGAGGGAVGAGAAGLPDGATGAVAGAAAQAPFRRTPGGTVVIGDDLVGAELSGAGWGAAREAAYAAGAANSRGDGGRSPSFASIAAAMCVVAALGAAANGASLVAAVLVGGALWLGSRRRRP